MSQSSKIFLKNRALGYVSNHVPCTTRYIPSRQENVIITCVGKAFHTYGSNHLSLLTVSEQTEEEIRCIAAQKKLLFTAEGNIIHSWKRSSVIYRTFKGHASQVHLLLPLGQLLVSVDEDNILKVWVISTQEVFLELTFDILTFKITALVHPHTYVNKILVGSEQGRMQIWNLKTSKLVHTFDRWDSSIVVLEQAPALDVVGVGMANGRIILHNLKYDETIVELTQECGAVTALSFRTDGPPLMISGSTSGKLVIWDLEEKKVASQMLDAHTFAVSAAICLPNEPLLVTNSADNSVKIWIFDQLDKGGRLLRKREGHNSQPKLVRFYHGNENHILSAGGSTLRVLNVINESMNYSMGQASYNRKASKRKGLFSEYLRMPSIVDYSVSTAKAKDWDNIAVVHLDIPTVTTWSYDKRRMGDHHLLPKRWTHISRVNLKVHATCVHVTNCGNFVVIGYSSGNLERFNIQSGLERCSYGDPVAHKGQIRGVCVDTLNQMVMSGCNGGLIKFWNFVPKHGTTCVTSFVKLTVEQPVAFFHSHIESSLVALVLDDFSVYLVDIETKMVVRKLLGHAAQVTDVTFSPDARWVITASLDFSIRTWDIPTAMLVDIFLVESPCISLTMSLSGQYLATTHVDEMGIFLWTNKTLFSHVTLKPFPESENVPLLNLPHTTGCEMSIDLMAEDELENSVELEEYNSPIQIKELITLSGFSSSRWANLLDIDLIRARNKQPASIPSTAPFFLPTLPSMDIKFDLSSEPTVQERLQSVSLDALSSRTPFAKLLADTDKDENFIPIITKLKEMGPSAINTELNALGFDLTNMNNLIRQFLKLISYMFSTNRDFELAQSYLGLLMKIHGDAISQSTELLENLKQVQVFQQESWDKLQTNIQYCLCVIDSLKM